MSFGERFFRCCHTRWLRESRFAGITDKWQKTKNIIAIIITSTMTSSALVLRGPSIGDVNFDDCSTLSSIFLQIRPQIWSQRLQNSFRLDPTDAFRNSLHEKCSRASWNKLNYDEERRALNVNTWMMAIKTIRVRNFVVKISGAVISVSAPVIVDN